MSSGSDNDLAKTMSGTLSVDFIHLHGAEYLRKLYVFSKTSAMLVWKRSLIDRVFKVLTHNLKKRKLASMNWRH